MLWAQVGNVLDIDTSAWGRSAFKVDLNIDTSIQGIWGTWGKVKIQVSSGGIWQTVYTSEEITSSEDAPDWDGWKTCFLDWLSFWTPGSGCDWWSYLVDMFKFSGGVESVTVTSSAFFTRPQADHLYMRVMARKNSLNGNKLQFQIDSGSTFEVFRIGD
jgi:hypothetical protein